MSLIGYIVTQGLWPLGLQCFRAIGGETYMGLGLKHTRARARRRRRLSVRPTDPTRLGSVRFGSDWIGFGFRFLEIQVILFGQKFNPTGAPITQTV
jgi:hypothetical protein